MMFENMPLGPPPPSNTGLPQGWKTQRSPEHQQVYYLNTNTGESTWALPTAPPTYFEPPPPPPQVAPVQGVQSVQRKPVGARRTQVLQPQVHEEKEVVIQSIVPEFDRYQTTNSQPSVQIEHPAIGNYPIPPPQSQHQYQQAAYTPSPVTETYTLYHPPSAPTPSISPHTTHGGQQSFAPLSSHASPQSQSRPPSIAQPTPQYFPPPPLTQISTQQQAQSQSQHYNSFSQQGVEQLPYYPPTPAPSSFQPQTQTQTQYSPSPNMQQYPTPPPSATASPQIQQQRVYTQSVPNATHQRYPLPPGTGSYQHPQSTQYGSPPPQQTAFTAPPAQPSPYPQASPYTQPSEKRKSSLGLSSLSKLSLSSTSNKQMLGKIGTQSSSMMSGMRSGFGKMSKTVGPGSTASPLMKWGSRAALGIGAIGAIALGVDVADGGLFDGASSMGGGDFGGGDMGGGGRQEAVDANAAYNAMALQGQENALQLLDPVGTTYEVVPQTGGPLDLI